MRVEHIKRRVYEQMVRVETIKRAYTSLLKDGQDNITRQKVEHRLEILKEDWEHFRVNHAALNLALDKVTHEEKYDLEKLDYFAQDVYFSTHEHYLSSVEKMTTLIGDQPEEPVFNASSSSSMFIHRPSYHYDPRLPRLTLPTYDGTQEQWLPFREMFESVVVSNKSISTIEKLQYLKCSLTGQAAQMLDNTTLTAGNFTSAWDKLISLYENPRTLIASAIDAFLDLRKMAKENSGELQRIYSSISQTYQNLENMRRPVQHWDDLWVQLIIRLKLDPQTVQAWEIYLGDTNEPPTWMKRSTFLSSRVRTLRVIEKSKQQSTSQSSSHPNFGHQRHPQFKTHFAGQPSFNNKSNSDKHCCLCSEQHYITRCPQYQLKRPNQRQQLVTKHKLCYNCLGPHKMAACRSTNRCLKCGKKHHTSLHLSEPSKPQPESTSTPAKKSNHVHKSHQNTDSRKIILLATALVKVATIRGETILARALLDQGSEISLVTENLVQRLQIHRKSSSLPIMGIGAQKSGKTRGIVSLGIKPHFESPTEFTLEAHVLPRLTTQSPSCYSIKLNWPHLEGLNLADPECTKPGTIDLIIGADTYGQLLEGSISQGPKNSPCAQLTKLGWVISGPTQTTTEPNNSFSFHCAIDHDLHALLEKFWHQEEVKPMNAQPLTSMEQDCENHFVKTHQRDETGRYIVKLPFKKPVEAIGDSKPSALRMMHHLWKRFEKDHTLFNAYSNFLTEYEKLRHMKRVKMYQDANAAFYLPHHGVIRESSSTTKLRVVFNGSCKVVGGNSLNEALHAGPKCQQDLINILLWMRQFRYIFSSDIEKMYRQILVHPDDRKYQRIFWKINDNLVEYELNTVTYGLACAPFLALRSILQLIQDEGSKYPLANDILLKGRYVDDIFGGAESIPEAQEKAQQVNKLCMAGGFPLRKWVSNNPEILNFLPVDHKVDTQSICIKDQAIHALGLAWNPLLDVFQFKLTPSNSGPLTKRQVLSRIAQFFDPLGLISPLFIKAKVFMQELWGIKLQWDDILPTVQCATWNKILDSLIGLETIQIPRWLGTASTGIIEIHGFSDASQLAMAAVVYLKTTYENKKNNVSILCSKTKVAPLKRMTIPRLELSAAVMLTKLTTHCIQVLNLSSVPCFLWTDSSIVFTWINNHPSKWKDFIHNRVCLIQESLPNARWKHVPGGHNPADCATRGLSSIELKQHSLWWKGPHWLSQSPSNWPNLSPPEIENSSIQLEVKTASNPISLYTTLDRPVWNLIDRYSSLTKLLRMTVFCRRAVQNKSFKNLFSPLAPTELLQARLFWVKEIQNQYFSREIKLLSEQQDLPKSSAIIRLRPYIDKQGLLRVGGRLTNSSLSLTAKHPYIIPKDSVLSTLIIHHSHQQTLHGSTQDTLAYIRNTYWILGGRTPVRSFILKCVKCTRYRKHHAQHIMGQLPAKRVTPSRAFLHTGVDYAGPINLKAWKGRTSKTYKAWIALFVCFSTSAIHLELVTDYTTEAFIAAYKRLTSRRGICATLISDCGTNFKGAEKELKKLFHQTSNELGQIATIIANDGTKWEFNPPATPLFGGKWEAGVKSVKYHLRRTIGDTLLTYEEFCTLLNQIEAILNSRPLCPMTDDPDDLDVLTPGHFLIGQPLTLIPEPNILQIQTSRLSRWQNLRQLTQSFWNKWMRSYIQRHQAMYKWTKSISSITEGSIVFIIDERSSPAHWPLGRILKLHRGQDGIARVAEVKTSISIVTRPIVKLCPIEITPSLATYSSPGSTKAAGKC